MTKSNSIFPCIPLYSLRACPFSQLIGVNKKSSVVMLTKIMVKTSPSFELSLIVFVI